MTGRDPWIRALVVVLLLIAAVYLAGLLWQVASQFSDLILLFVLAWVISFVLEPVVVALQVHVGLPRSLAVLGTYLIVLVSACFAIIQLVPRLSAQMVQVVNDLPVYAEWLNLQLLELQAWLAHQGVLVAPEMLFDQREIMRRVEAFGPQVVANSVVLATSLANLLFQVLIVLILSYYFTLDGQRIATAALLALPAAYRDEARYFLASVNRAFGGFLRGQLAQAAIAGLGTAVIMSIAGLKFVLLTSVACGLLMLIPFIGPFAAILLPALVAAVTQPDRLLPTIAALFIQQQIVVNVLAPRLLSQTTGLHPLLVFVGVLGGAKLAGAWGAIFGVPIIAVISTMVSFYHATVEDRQARLRHAASALPAEPWPERPTTEATSAVRPEHVPTAGSPPALADDGPHQSRKEIPAS